MQGPEIKSSIRQRLLKKRDSIPAPVRAVKDSLVQEAFFSLDEFRNSRVIFCFASFRTETDTLGIIEKSLASGKRVVVPKVDAGQRRLLLYEIFSAGELACGYMGIPEPSVTDDGRLVGVNDVDLVVIPGAAFDQAGDRIGYGGGYYDRLLAELNHPVPVVAPAYEEQIIGEIPAEAHDVRVDVIVTDRRVIRTGGRKR